jgi:magnesium transporter
LIITALNAGDVTLHQWRRVVLREIAMGLALGSFLAMLGIVMALLLIDRTRDSWEWHHLMVFPATLLIVVTCGAMVGSILPLLFRRMGLDPALMSNPFVSGIMDIVGIATYMNVALWLIKDSS